MNVQSDIHVPTHLFLQQRGGGGGINKLFGSMSSAAYGVDKAEEEKRPGIPCHIVHNMQWIDADALIKELGGNIHSQDDIMAPSAALDQDSVRTVAGKNYISAPALVRRMRMNDRSRDFAVTVIRNFLTSAVGKQALNMGERLGEYYVDIYVPNAKLAVDINGGTLTSSTQKRVFLERNGITLITFNCGTVAPAGHSRDDVERLMFSALPKLFAALVANYRVGSHMNSTTVHSHFTNMNTSTTGSPNKLKATKLRRGYSRDAPYVSRRF